MRVVICLLGVEVFSLSTEPESPPTEADGVEITRHSGEFDIGLGFRAPLDSDLS